MKTQNELIITNDENNETATSIELDTATAEAVEISKKMGFGASIITTAVVTGSMLIVDWADFINCWDSCDVPG